MQSHGVLIMSLILFEFWVQCLFSYVFTVSVVCWTGVSYIFAVIVAGACCTGVSYAFTVIVLCWTGVSYMFTVIVLCWTGVSYMFKVIVVCWTGVSYVFTVIVVCWTGVSYMFTTIVLCWTGVSCMFTVIVAGLFGTEEGEWVVLSWLKLFFLEWLPVSNIKINDIPLLLGSTGKTLWLPMLLFLYLLVNHLECLHPWCSLAYWWVGHYGPMVVFSTLVSVVVIVLCSN